MSIVTMQKVFLCARRENRKDILESLQRLGVVEISNMSLDEPIFKKIETNSNRLIFEKNSLVANKSVEIINSFLQEKSSFLDTLNGKKIISKEDYYKFVSNQEEIMRVAYRILELEEKISQKKANIKNLEIKKEKLESWLDFDYSMRFKGTKKTTAFLGSFPKEYTFEELKSKLDEILPDFKNIALKILNSNLGQTCVFIICKVEDTEKVEESIKSLGFSYPTFLSKKSPSEKFKKISDKIEKIKLSIENKENEIKSYVGVRNALKFISDYFKMRSQKYEVISKLMYSKNVFILEGFIPKSKSSKLESVLSSDFDIAMNFEDVDSLERPVLLKNSKFSEPVETIVESYSLPGKDEVDPTSTMSVFYYILFGLMLSDAAYGAIMAFGCFGVIKKFKNMEYGLKKTLKMFMYCGISTMFWGVMFGSYFGNAIQIISKTFFHKEIIISPLWFEPLKKPMLMLSFSFGLGLLHLFSGLFLLMIQKIKAKKYLDVFYDVISWYFLIGGGVLYILTVPSMTTLLGLKFTLPSLVGTISIFGVIIGALCILFTAGRESKSPFKRFLKGIYGLYGVTTYLSDMFSYSRLFALGLATGVIANVFNQMGAMAGDGIVGIILFTFVFIIGHTMNIAINLLGAYVHTNRLQFVEFFSKFYEGGGKKFSPFSINTKYYNIKEDI